MRIILLLILAGGAGWADDAVGVWNMIPGHSTFAVDRPPRTVTLRIESHSKGEVLTMERTELDGHSTSESILLYLDGKARAFEDFECRGNRSSQRVDNQTVEILRTCEAGGWTRVVMRRMTNGNDLVLQVSGRRSDGRQVEARLVLEKQ
jgi:hypothetical protein